MGWIMLKGILLLLQNEFYLYVAEEHLDMEHGVVRIMLCNTVQCNQLSLLFDVQVWCRVK